MSPCFRNVLAAAVAAGLVLSTADARAQNAAKAQPKPAAPPATPTAAAAAHAALMAKSKEVLATVNGEPITRGDILGFLGSYPRPEPGEEQEVYAGAIDELVSAKLVGQFLKKTRVPIKKEEFDAEIASFEQNVLAPRKATFAQFYADTGLSAEEFRQRIGERLQWKTYLMSRATDAELQKYFLSRKDVFDGKQVRASHILVKVDPAATSADKEKAKQKIAAIRDEILAKKISFPDAANKYSEDEMGGIKNGGDLDFFPRRGKYLDAFADAAFGLKKGEISGPVFTEYGWHLIQQTDVLPGKPVDLVQIKERVTAQYAQELHEAIVEAERAKAKVTVQPLPADLFPKAVPPAPADATKAAPATKGEAPKR